MIGTLGNMAFQVSHQSMRTFNNFSRSGEARVEQHNVIGKKPILEFVAPGLDQITFSIRLDRFFGLVPEDELSDLRAARDEGQILPFIVGGRYLGRWVITSLSETHAKHDGAGKIIVAEASITLMEVAEDGTIYGVTAGQAN